MYSLGVLQKQSDDHLREMNNLACNRLVTPDSSTVNFMTRPQAAHSQLQ